MEKCSPGVQNTRSIFSEMNNGKIEQELLLPMNPNDSDLECSHVWCSYDDYGMQIRTQNFGFEPR